MTKIECFLTRVLRAIAAACLFVFVLATFWMGALPEALTLRSGLTNYAQAQGAIFPSDLSVAQLQQNIARDANGNALERTNVIDGPNGLQVVQFIDIATGEIVSQVESNTPNAGGGNAGGGGNTGGNVGNTGGISGDDAAAKIDGVSSVTNPETVDGDVLSVFGIVNAIQQADDLEKRLADFFGGGRPSLEEQLEEELDNAQRQQNSSIINQGNANGPLAPLGNNPNPQPAQPARGNNGNRVAIVRDENGAEESGTGNATSSGDNGKCAECLAELKVLEEQRDGIPARIEEIGKRIDELLQELRDPEAFPALEVNDEDSLESLRNRALSSGVSEERIDQIYNDIDNFAGADADLDAEITNAQQDVDYLNDSIKTQEDNLNELNKDLEALKSDDQSNPAVGIIKIGTKSAIEKTKQSIVRQKKELQESEIRLSNAKSVKNTFDSIEIDIRENDNKFLNFFDQLAESHQKEILEDFGSELGELVVQVNKFKRDDLDGQLDDLISERKFLRDEELNRIKLEIKRKKFKISRDCPSGSASSNNFVPIENNTSQPFDLLHRKSAQRSQAQTESIQNRPTVFERVTNKQPSSTNFERRFSSTNPSVSTLAYGPRRITSNNGVTAISDRAVNARFDLRKWRKTQERQYGQAASLGERVDPNVEDGRPLIDLPGFLGDNRFNLFGASSVSIGNNDVGGLGQDSISYSASGGVSWLVLPKLNVGLAARYSDGDIDSFDASIDTSTWGIAAFAQTQVESKIGKINLEGIIAYSRSDIDSLFNNAGVITTANDVNTTAFSSQVKASTSFTFDNVSISPFVSLSYIATDRDAFTLSDGQFQNGVNGDQVTFSAGSSLGTSFVIPDTEILLSPSLGLGTFGTVTNGGNVGLSANGSLGIQTKSGVSGGLGVGFSGLTGGTSNLSFSGNISIPLN